MKKIAIFSVLIILVVVLAITKFASTAADYKTVKFSNTSVKAEVADTPQKRVEGLMFKKTLPNYNGMLFIFEKEDYHAIWMMNMSFPIDILWINKDLKIIDIVEGARPCKINCVIYFPDEKALYVLEVNSEFVAKNEINLGDSIIIN